MARKGREPLAEAPPPAVTSSDEESEDESDDEQQENQQQPQLTQTQQQQQQQQENQSSSSDEDDEDDEEDEDEEENPPSTPPPPQTHLTSNKKTSTHKKSQPIKPTKDSDSEQDSDSSPPVKTKPISSKPIEPKKQQPRSNSKPNTTTVAALAAKRAGSDPEKGSGSTSKKPKREKTEKEVVPTTTATATDDGERKLFQRLWSEDDEIVILKGMIEYKAKKGVDAMSDLDGFFEFIKKNLHVVDVGLKQFVNKVRRLKKKYENNAKKKRITNPHELNAFVLSKNIWGSDGVKNSNGFVNEDNINDDGNDKDSSLKSGNVKSRSVSNLNSNTNSKSSKSGSEVVTLDNGKKVEDGKRKKSEGNEGNVEEKEKGGNWVISRCDREIQFGSGGGSVVGLFGEGFVKEGMKLVDEEKRAELEEKWRKHNVLEAEMYLKRLDLLRETAQTALNGMKSAKH